MHAAHDLRFSTTELEHGQVKELARIYTEDEQQADDIAMESYLNRLRFAK